jgi:hypothetical protein
VVVSVLVLVGCVYILVDYQHPEDRNQAWVPKIVVVLGLSLAIFSVLMFPLVSMPVLGSKAMPVCYTQLLSLGLGLNAHCCLVCLEMWGQLSYHNLI